MNTPATALLVIDAQVNMFDEAAPVHDGPLILERLAALVARARAAGVPVVFVQHGGGVGEVDEPGMPGWHIHPACAPLAGERVVHKTRPDAFDGTALGKTLQALDVGRLVVAGMQSDLCVHATCSTARALGYQVVLVEDAHSTYPSGGRTAREIIERVNAEPRGSVALVAERDAVFA